LVILHWELQMRTNAEAPPSDGKKISALEINSCGSTAPIFLQEINDMIEIRNGKSFIKCMLSPFCLYIQCPING